MDKIFKDQKWAKIRKDMTSQEGIDFMRLIDHRGKKRHDVVYVQARIAGQTHECALATALSHGES